MPIILILSLMFVLWIRYQTKKSTQTIESASEEFWRKEQEANFIRNQPLDSINFIEVPLHQLPIIESTDKELQKLQDTLLAISKEKIANLSQYTNTELKLTYGTGNFTFLSQCDTNYITLLQTIQQLANLHQENDNIPAAIAYYEYAVECKSENSNTYVNLALLYSHTNNEAKVEDLKNLILLSEYKNKDTILKKVERSLLEDLLSN